MEENLGAIIGAATDGGGQSPIMACMRATVSESGEVIILRPIPSHALYLAWGCVTASLSSPEKELLRYGYLRVGAIAPSCHND
jgi:hypothetical protein